VDSLSKTGHKLIADMFKFNMAQKL